jgi:predicted protein tyrosine phosphatase
MIKAVTFLPRREAERTIGTKKIGLISIRDTETEGANLRGDWGAVLRLHFDDVERGWPGRCPMDENDAIQILDWLDVNVSRLTTLFVHCEAGISRSSAVAQFIGEKYDVWVGGVEKPRPNQHVLWMLRKVYRERNNDTVRKGHDDL